MPRELQKPVPSGQKITRRDNDCLFVEILDRRFDDSLLRVIRRKFPRLRLFTPDNYDCVVSCESFCGFLRKNRYLVLEYIFVKNTKSKREGRIILSIETVSEIT
jgi:hypothetical protein